MSINASASITCDINFTMVETGESSQSEASALAYSQSFTNGTGANNIAYGVLTSGILTSGGSEVINLSGITKRSFGVDNTIVFAKVRGIVVENRSTVYGYDIGIHATGVNAITDLFNGGSGNLMIKPKSPFIYADPISGLDITGTSRLFTIDDIGGSGASWSVIVIGNTG